MINFLRNAWRYRFFIFTSIKTELRVRFITSRLGAAWMILHPLSQVIIFAFVLSAVMSAKLPGVSNRYGYAIYLMAGTLCWSLFTEIVSRSVNLFVENGNILKKLVFPKIALPLIVSGSALVNNIMLLTAILIIFAVLGHTPGMSLIWLPLLIVVNISFALGFGLVLGVLNVFIRDIAQAVPVFMQFLFWFTPIVYTSKIIPEHYQVWLKLNPLRSIVIGYQNVLVYNTPPQWHSLSYDVLLAFILLIFALVLFRKASPEMVDQL